jgi:16S rRNA (guanine527-N7)-methyltransferase
MSRLYAGIVSGNRQLNLTRITEPREFWEKHLWDSLSGVVGMSLEAESSLEVIDIGTGAGFPGLPVAIAFPHWTVTLLDSTQKKMFFLKTLIEQLGSKNAKILIGRAEEIGQQQQHRERYDLALIRAVGSPSVCAEYALPLLKLDGLAILYRGHWLAEDGLNLSKATAQLGAEIETIRHFETPMSNSDRNCIYIRKKRPTPKQFPRAVGVPRQSPL